MRGGVVVIALLTLTGYVAAYFVTPRLPAANLAYFIYSENPRMDSACYYLFIPAYRLHQRLCEATNRGFIRHNWDRPNNRITEGLAP